MKLILCAIGLLALLINPVNAATGKDFYNGKTVKWIVAVAPGGGFDFYARLFARHMQKALPESKFVVINRPGAGHRIGVNLIYASKPNGLTIGSFGTNVAYSQIMKLKGNKFDLNKMSWIGKAATDVKLLLVGANSEYKTWKDILESKRKIKWSSNAMNSGSWNGAILLSQAFNLNYRIIAGYQGAEIALGMMRNETDIRFMGAGSALELVRNGQGRIVLRFGDSKNFGPELNSVTNAKNVATTDTQKTLVEMYSLYGQLSRTVAGPPGIIPDRLKTLRQVFLEAANSSALRAQAKKVGRPIDPVGGEETAALVRAILKQPPEVTKMLKDMNKVKFAQPSVVSAGKVIKTKKRGRRITIDMNGKKVTAKVSGARTKVYVNGKRVKRKKIKVGMDCVFHWPKLNSEATKIDCKN